MTETNDGQPERYVPLIAIARAVGRDVSSIHKTAKRNGLTVEKMRDSASHNQIVSVISVSDLRKLMEAIDDNPQICGPDDTAAIIEKIRKERSCQP